MKRTEIMSSIPESIENIEGVHGWLKDIIDEFENKILEIKDLLKINDLSDLHQIEEAYEVVSIEATDLY